MKKIEWMLGNIKDEVKGAMMYAESYVMHKTTHPDFARMYAEMANQELNHADYLTTIYKAQIDSFAYVPEDDKDMWDDCLKKVAEKSAIIKLMLSK